MARRRRRSGRTRSRRRWRRRLRDLALVVVLGALVAGVAAWSVSASRSFVSTFFRLPDVSTLVDLSRQAPPSPGAPALR